MVSYNTRELLAKCLASVEEDADEVIVVDNASTDGSAEMVARRYPRARLVRNETNLGFGAANNLGIGLAQNELVLLLNSDAEATPGAIERLASEFNDPGVVAAGGKLITTGANTAQRSAARRLTLWAVFCEQTLLEKLFPLSRVFSPYWFPTEQSARIEVEQVMGACLMMRPIERFDERFFLYVEDTELCHRLRRHGKILYVPDAMFYHALGGSSASERWRAVAQYNRGKELFFRIHAGVVAMSVCWLLNRMGAALRLVGWTLLAAIRFGRSREANERIRIFWKVLTCAPTGPPKP